MGLEPVDVVIAVDDIGLRDQRVEEWDRGLDAVDDELAERPLEPHETFVARAGMHDELADQTVIIGWNRVAGIGAGIDSDPEPAGWVEMGDGAGRRPERMRVLGIDAALDGVPVEAHVLLAERKRRAGRDPDLLDDEVEPGDHFGDGVLDLEARVHLDEVELVVLVEKLDGADAAIAEIAHRLRHRLADTAALARVESGRRGPPPIAFDDAAGASNRARRDGWHCRARRPALAPRYGGMDEIFLEIDGVVAESGASLVACGLERRLELALVERELHAASAAPRRGLDHDRIADVAGKGFCFLDIAHRTRARNDRDAERARRVLGHDLVAHQPDVFCGRSDKGDGVLLEDLGETSVLGEKPIARMHGVGAGDLAGRDDRGDVEIAVLRWRAADAHALVGKAHMHGVGVGSGVDRDGRDAKLLASPFDAKRDLSPVRDQDLVEHRAPISVARSPPAARHIRPAGRPPPVWR